MSYLPVLAPAQTAHQVALGLMPLHLGLPQVSNGGGGEIKLVVAELVLIPPWLAGTWAVQWLGAAQSHPMNHS